MQKQKAAPSDLAKLILEWDAAYPGDVQAPMEIPAKDWARFIAAAKAELKQSLEAA